MTKKIHGQHWTVTLADGRAYLDGEPLRDWSGEEPEADAEHGHAVASESDGYALLVDLHEVLGRALAG